MQANMMKDMMTTSFLMNSDNPLYSFLLIQLLEQGTKYFEQFILFLKTLFDNWFENKKDEIMTKTNIEYKVISSITFERLYSNESIRENPDIDGLLYYISNKFNIKSLFYNGHIYLMNFYENFDLTDNIKCKLCKFNKDVDGNITKLKFTISSCKLNMLELRKFISKCRKEYERNQKNKLGIDKYYFDQTMSPIHNDKDKLLFIKNKFVTNRNFNNIFFTGKEILENRVKLFEHNKEWYDERGLPHTLGFLLHGVPGTGKTSTIKAVANYTNRHIINIHSDMLKTKKQLLNLFYNEEITVLNGVNCETFLIPIEERLFIFEDVDCMGDLLLDRSIKKPKKQKINDSDIIYDKNQITEEEKITLSDLLNILDGTLELPGRIIILTSNYPELLDSALIRPGRIDMILNLGMATPEIIKQLYKLYYKEELNCDNLPHDKWTPAQISQIYFNNIIDKKKAIDIIINDKPFIFKNKEKKLEEFLKINHDEIFQKIIDGNSDEILNYISSHIEISTKNEEEKKYMNNLSNVFTSLYETYIQSSDEELYNKVDECLNNLKFSKNEKRYYIIML